MYIQSIIINLVTIIEDQKEGNTPSFGFKDMVKEYASNKKYYNVEVFFIVYKKSVKGEYNIIYELKQGVLGWYLEDDAFFKSPTNKNLDIGNPLDLTKILNHLIQEKHKDYNKILVTYAHGTGFNIFGSGVGVGDTPNKDIELEYFTYTKFAFNKNKDEKENNKKRKISTLTMDELSVAIAETKFKKFDAIFLGNCFMQNMDTFYALRNTTKYLIASETTFSWQGFDYSLFNRLFHKLDDAFIQGLTYFSFLDIYDAKKGYQTTDLESKNEMVISVIKCEDSESFFEKFKKVVQYLKQYKSALDLDEIEKLRDTTGIKVSNILKDLKNILILSNTKIISNPPNNLIIECLNYLDKLIISKEIGEIIKQYQLKINGLSINLPVNVLELTYFSYFTSPFASSIDKDGYYLFDPSKRNPLQTSFSKENGWGDFVYELLKFNKVRGII